MKPFILGIAGGTGTGKSTLAYGLEDRYPGRVSVVNLDDYFHPAEEVPIHHGMTAWDDPDSLDTTKLAADLLKLKEAKPTTILTKSTRLNPNFSQTRRKIPVVYEAKPLVVVDGWLLLWFEEIRKLLDLSVYLNAPLEVHLSRRDSSNKQEPFDPVYDEKIIKPMHRKYVEKSKKYADIVLDVHNLTAPDVLAETISLLPKDIK